MSDLASRIRGQDGFIKDILDISGSPALSVGVLHEGQIVSIVHYGTREEGKQLAPNDDTMYRVASLTKVMTASAVAALVKDGVLEWDAPITKYLPAFRERKDEAGETSTLRDLLANRTGLASGDYYWGQQHGEFLMPHDELVRIAANVVAAKPFRTKFVYAGWNYGLVTEVVEAVTGMTLGQFLNERVYAPLGMKRTTLTDTYDYDNVALGYGIDSDGSRHHIPFQQMNDGIGLAGAYGAKSSIKDLLTMYKALLSAQQEQAKSGLTTSPGSPFNHTKEIFEPQISVFGPTAYCLGLYRSTLPSVLGLASLNTIAWLGLNDSPIMGQKNEGLNVWHHTGNLPGCMASCFLLPDTQTAVVAVTNSIGFMDPTDFVTQRLLAVVLGEEMNEELIELAKKARASNLSQYPRLTTKLLKGRKGTCDRSPESYEGHYWNKAGNFCLTIVRQADGRGLRMKVQDVPRTGYDLEPYDGDVWWWRPDRKKELCEDGMFAITHPAHHLIKFGSSTKQRVDTLSWHHDVSAGAAETFYRSEEKPRWKGYPFPRANL